MTHSRPKTYKYATLAVFFFCLYSHYTHTLWRNGEYFLFGVCMNPDSGLMFRRSELINSGLYGIALQPDTQDGRYGPIDGVEVGDRWDTR